MPGDCFPQALTPRCRSLSPGRARCRSGGHLLGHLCSLGAALFPMCSEKPPCLALSLPPGPTHPARPPITINLANFLGHTVPRGPHFGGQQRNKTPCYSPSLLITRDKLPRADFGRQAPGRPGCPHRTMHTCSGEFPPRLIRAGKKRAFLLVVKGGPRC